MIKTKILIKLIFTFLLLLACRKKEPARKNPFDSEGQCWFPPTVIAMEDTTVCINDTVILHASYKDENGYVNKYFWALDGENFKDTADSVFKTVFTEVGVRKIKVRCVDNQSIPSRNVDSVFVTVVEKKDNLFRWLKKKLLRIKFPF